VELDQLKAIVKQHNITFKSGDVLLVRVGFTEEYNKLSEAEMKAFPERANPGFLGLVANEEMFRFLWDNEFSAIASDSPSCERSPTMGAHNPPDENIHQVRCCPFHMREPLELTPILGVSGRLGDAVRGDVRSRRASSRMPQAGTL
jgi:hypothetical protein